ncbi:MAG: hypothetical protein J6Y03_02240 [Alphaproteobacteria bacterium]|nr:hypothetical protein [Alphaproteobacteria bacterium]
MPQLDFSFYPAQIFWLIISFGILFLAMKYWLLPPLANVIEQREEKIKKILRQADKMSAEAERIGKEYQQYVDEAIQYSTRVLQTAHDEVAANYANQEENLLQILKTDTQKAEDDINQEKKNLLGGIEDITYHFVKIFLKVFYSLKLSEKDTQEQISFLIKEKKDV